MKNLLFLLGLKLLLILQPALAEDLTVSTVTRPPFSMMQDETHVGFSMELMNAIAKEMEWNVEVQRHSEFAEMLSAAASGRSDMAIANISITSAREEVMDFSQPIFESGLRIMIPAQAARSPSLFRTVMSTDLLLAIGAAFLVLFCGGMLMWLFERRAQPYFDRPASEALFPSFWWALNLVVNGGFEERMPRTIFGRVFAVMLVVSSLFIVSVFVAKITSVMTVEAITSNVNGVSDLYGQRVATIDASTAAGFLDRREIDYVAYPGLDEMLRAFEGGEIDAIVFDSPILSYYAAHDGKEFGTMTGSVFLRENYGIAFPSGSPHLEDVNRVLLSLREDGTYDALYRRWFGNRN